MRQQEETQNTRGAHGKETKKQQVNKQWRRNPRMYKVVIENEEKTLNSHVEIEYVPPYSTSCLGFEQAKGSGEFIGIYR